MPKIDKHVHTDDYDYSEEEFDYVYESPKDDDSIAKKITMEFDAKCTK